MKFAQTAFAVATVAATAEAVVPVSIRRASPKLPDLVKRTSTYSQTLANNETGGGYFATVQVGTPGQKVQLILDTGSSDTWVLASSADLCNDASMQNEYGGCMSTFDSSSSSTFKVISKDSFEIQYEDGTGATGDYFSDNINVGGAKVTGLQMGIATQTTINSGIMGIAFDTDEAAASVYPNLIDVMQSEGLISARAYSLWLDDLQSSTGTILFGGLDTAKFQGDLKVVPIARDATTLNYTSFTVALSSFSYTDANGDNHAYSTSGAEPVILDSGTSLTYLPSYMTEKLYNDVNAVDDTMNSGIVYADCGLLNKSITFDFQFGGSNGPVVKVPVDEMVIDDLKDYISSGDLQPPQLPFTDVCDFGIQPSDQDFLLGDTFLRSAYVVYDLDNLEIGIAQTDFDATGSSVVEIKGGSSDIPAASGTATEAEVTQTATGRVGAPGSGATGGVSGTQSGSSATATAGSSGSGTQSGSSGSSSSTGSSNAGARPAPGWQAVGVAALAGAGMLLGTLFMI